jgi:hypothetical protein
VQGGRVVPPMVVYGLPCTGKTGCVLDLLATFRLRHVHVLCSTVFSARQLFAHVLEQLGGTMGADAAVDADEELEGNGAADAVAGRVATVMSSSQYIEFASRVTALLEGATRPTVLVRTVSTSSHPTLRPLSRHSHRRAVAGQHW